MRNEIRVLRSTMPKDSCRKTQRVIALQMKALIGIELVMEPETHLVLWC